MKTDKKSFFSNILDKIFPQKKKQLTKTAAEIKKLEDNADIKSRIDKTANNLISIVKSHHQSKKIDEAVEHKPLNEPTRCPKCDFTKIVKSNKDEMYHCKICGHQFKQHFIYGTDNVCLPDYVMCGKGLYSQIQKPQSTTALPF